MQNDTHSDDGTEDVPLNSIDAQPFSATEDKVEGEDEFSLDDTPSQRLFDDLFISSYIPLEVWYIRTIIDKVCPSLSFPTRPLLSVFYRPLDTNLPPLPGSSPLHPRPDPHPCRYYHP